jgi:hypothetical protein
MTVKFAFVCDAANLAQSGNLNVLGIFNSINAQKIPCTHAKFMYVANIEFHRSEVGQHDFKLSFVDEDGREIIKAPSGTISVGEPAGNMPANTNLMLEFLNVTFPRKGSYQIDLTVDRQHASSVRIQVVEIPAKD